MSTIKEYKHYNIIKEQLGRNLVDVDGLDKDIPAGVLNQLIPNTSIAEFVIDNQTILVLFDFKMNETIMLAPKATAEYNLQTIINNGAAFGSSEIIFLELLKKHRIDKKNMITIKEFDKYQNIITINRKHFIVSKKERFFINKKDEAHEQKS